MADVTSRIAEHPRTVLALIVVIAALLRLYRFYALDLWLDEGYTLHAARLPWATVMGFHGAYENHPPLYFVLVKLTGLVVHELYAGRVVSIIAGTATVLALNALASRILGTWPALVASAALAISPLHIWYSQEARMYALSGLFVTTSYVALVAFYRSPRWGLSAGYGVSLLAAMYSNYGAIYTLAPQVALLAITTRRLGRRSIAIWSAALAAGVGFLPWLPQLLSTTTNLGGLRESYLGVTYGKIWASVLSVVGLGGAGSYFWGSGPTPWERWPGARPILLVSLASVVAASGVAMARRPLSAIVVVTLLPGTIVTAALLSLVSPGYADRTVLAAVIGWALVFGAIAADRIPRGLRAAGWTGAAFTVLMSLVTLRTVYVGGDKQHWSALASQTAVAARLGYPVWVYPTYAAPLIDAYEPAVLGLLNRRDESSPNLVIGDGSDAPPSEADAIWLAYIEAAGIERVQHQLTERGYERVMHRYHWHPLYLDLYIKAAVRPGRAIPINGRFEEPAAAGKWRIEGAAAAFSSSDTGGRIIHLQPGTSDSRLMTSISARSDRLYLMDLDAQATSTANLLRAFVTCASGSTMLETGPDGDGASVPADGRWHRASAAVICPQGTERVMVDIRNVGPGELLIRDVELREVTRVDDRSLPRSR
jgi:hypothetical protein